MGARRILFLIDDLKIGGAEQVVVNLVTGLPKEEFIPTVCALEGGPLIQVLKERGIDTFIINKKYPFDFGFLLFLINLIKKRGIQLIHTNLLVSSIYGWIAAKLLKLPVVITIHGENIFNLQHGGNIFPFIVRHSDSLIAVSYQLRAYIDEYRKIKNAKVVYNGIDTDRFNGNLSRTKVRAGLGLLPDDLVIGTVGGLRPAKNHSVLFSAFKKVKEVNSRIKLMIVGDGPLFESLRSLVRSLKLEESVLFTGERRDIPELLTVMDIFVLPSLFEGLPISLIEAMASGLPVVASRVGGIPEVIEKNNGILVQPDDTEGLKDALLTLLNDEETRIAMGKENRKRVKAHFSLSKMTAEYESVYATLIEKGGN